VPIRRPARLEQNRHGVFVQRLVIPLAHRGADGKPRDMRISLRTRDPAQARALSLPREQVAGFELVDVPDPALQAEAGVGGIKGKRPSKKDKLRAARAG
jgi:hypothetical protein